MLPPVNTPKPGGETLPAVDPAVSCLTEMPVRGAGKVDDTKPPVITPQGVIEYPVGVLERSVFELLIDIYPVKCHVDVDNCHPARDILSVSLTCDWPYVVTELTGLVRVHSAARGIRYAEVSRNAPVPCTA